MSSRYGILRGRRDEPFYRLQNASERAQLMPAFALISNGTARDLARAVVAAFPSARQFSASAWLVSADDDATSKSICARLGLASLRDSAIVIQIDPARVWGFADDATWTFINRAAKPKTKASTSIYDQ